MPTTILEAAIQSVSVLLTCRCGRSASYWTPGLWWLFEQRAWNDEFVHALARFRCRTCTEKAGAPVRPKRIEVVKEGALDIAFPEPEARAWKRALSRVR